MSDTQRRSIYHLHECPYQIGGACNCGCIERNPHLTDEAWNQFLDVLATEEKTNVANAKGDLRRALCFDCLLQLRQYLFAHPWLQAASIIEFLNELSVKDEFFVTGFGRDAVGVQEEAEV